MSFHKWFIPHKDTHQKAHLITWHALAIYLLIFILLQVGMDIFSHANPGVLGTTSNIPVQRLIELTNIERQKAGLPPLTQNSSLSQAATAKAANMFEENYWAHFTPSGKSPWDFIVGSGYKFTSAGENLAKNFHSPEDVVAAWMASPSHKENILNSKFREIGFAIEDGVLEGNQTTLIVQMFGTTEIAGTAVASTPASTTQPKPRESAQPIVHVGGQEIKLSQEKLENPKPLALLQTISAQQLNPQNPPLFDPFLVTKYYSSLIIILVAILLVIDFIVLRHRGVFRLTSHHFAHVSILLSVAAAIALARPGGVL